MGMSLSLAEGSSLYDSLLEGITKKRAENYNSFVKELRDIEASRKVEKEERIEAKGREFEALPQMVEQWRKENPTSLLSLRLKILTAQISKKTKEAQEWESQLSTAFQSLLTQWTSPPKVEESPPQHQKRTILTLPSPPSPLSPWWKSPSLISLPPPTPELEREIEKKMGEFSQQVSKEKLQSRERVRGYERILEEVRRRCPLP
jgi:hypothetical protein